MEDRHGSHGELLVLRSSVTRPRECAVEKQASAGTAIEESFDKDPHRARTCAGTAGEAGTNAERRQESVLYLTTGEDHLLQREDEPKED